jgi:hypothetical protein
MLGSLERRSPFLNEKKANSNLVTVLNVQLPRHTGEKDNIAP